MRGCAVLNWLCGDDKVGKDSAKILAKVAEQGVKMNPQSLECVEGKISTTGK